MLSVMHAELWEMVRHLDGETTAKRAKCEYLAEPGRYVVTFLNRRYVVNLAQRSIFQEGSPEDEAGFLEQICLLSYLISAKKLAASGKLVREESLPGGEFFFRGPHVLPVVELVEAFGNSPQEIYRSCEALNCKKRDFGDAAVEILALPRVALTFIVWGRDDEFDARASILFDQTAEKQLALDALLAVVNLAVKAIIESGE